MKSVKILLSVALAVVGVVAMAQDFQTASGYLKQLLDKCPKA